MQYSGFLIGRRKELLRTYFYLIAFMHISGKILLKVLNFCIENDNISKVLSSIESSQHFTLSGITAGCKTYGRDVRFRITFKYSLTKIENTELCVNAHIMRNGSHGYSLRKIKILSRKKSFLKIRPDFLSLKKNRN